MKKKYILIFSVLTIIVKFSFAQIIVIDPGHNDEDIVDCSANPITGNRTATEVNTNWDVAVRLENMITSSCLGWGVEKTKSLFTEYKSIDDRENRANVIKRGTTEDVYFLSIHCNAGDGHTAKDVDCDGNWYTGYSGTETFYCNQTYNSDDIGLASYAQNVQDNMVLYGVWTDRRVVEDSEYYCSTCHCGGHLCVLNGLEMPNCLNEIGFQDVQADADKLNDPTWRHNFAYGYFQAFKETFNQEDDLGIVSLVLPATDGEFTANEEVKIKIRNYGLCNIDFSNNPFTFQVDVVGPNNYTFTHELNTGELQPDYEMDVTITNICDLTALGEYCFNISIINGNDGNILNNTLNDQCVNSLQLLTADFTHTLDVSTSYKVHFTDQSTPASKITARNWNFGDIYNAPSTSTIQNPVYTYSEAGTYTVNLVVTDNIGNTAAVPKDIIVDNNIQPPLAASFTANPTTGEAPLLVSFNSSGSQGNYRI